MLIIIFVIIINILQTYKSKYLPAVLRTWLWLPRPLRSLGWYDENLFGRQCCCCCKKKETIIIIDDNVHNNESYTDDQNQDNV